MLAPNDHATRAVAPVLVQQACNGFFRPHIVEDFEAVLAQADSRILPSVPGPASLNGVEPCRTWICQYTRAVPHGSFL